MARVGRISLGDWIPVMGSRDGRSADRGLGKLATGQVALICLVIWERRICDGCVILCG